MRSSWLVAFVGLPLLSAGCVIEGDGGSGDAYDITGGWTVTAADGTPVGCVDGAATVRLRLHPDGGGFDEVGEFDCTAGLGVVRGVPAGHYVVTAELAERPGTDALYSSAPFDFSVVTDAALPAAIQIPLPPVHVVASWFYKEGGTTVACPAGIDTARVTSLAERGEPVVDLFDCDAGTGTTQALPQGIYQVWVELTDHDGTTTYAESLSDIVTLGLTDGTTNQLDIHGDRGYFQLAYTLENAGAPTTCDDAGAAAVSIAATITGGSTLFDSEVPCEQGSALSAALPAGSYTVSVSANNLAGEAVGTAPALANQIVEDRNRVTSLGTLVIDVTP